MRYFISDTHFGHEKCWSTFKRVDGSPLRAFSSTEEMDQTMIRNWNQTVKAEDSVYHLGDYVINRKHMHVGHQLAGRKRLVRGNHDIFKTDEYIALGFEEIYGVWVDPKSGIICSHIPLHPDSIKEGWINVHGHLHHGRVLLPNKQIDKRYVCVSVEMTDYKPVSLGWIRAQV
jgi:calcineurin-like phosphoesterase family protein